MKKLILPILMVLVFGVLSCATIHSTAREGNTNELQNFLSDGVDINVRDDNNYTPLMIAAKAGKDENVSFLISKGADVNAIADTGITALMLAAGQNKDTTVSVLIKGGANLNFVTTSSEEITALGNAAMTCSDKAFRVLLDNGAEVVYESSHHLTVADMALGNWIKVCKDLNIAIINKIRSGSKEDKTEECKKKVEAMGNIIKYLRVNKYKPQDAVIEQMELEADAFNTYVRNQGYGYIGPVMIPSF